MDWSDVIREDGVVISFPKKFTKALHVFWERGFIIHEDGECFRVISPTSYSVTRDQTGLTPNEFLEFYNSLKVLGGSKAIEVADEIIHITPKRPLRISFRVSAAEHRLIEFAARQYLLDVSEFVRMCVLDKAIESFIRAKKQREAGLV